MGNERACITGTPPGFGTWFSSSARQCGEMVPNWVSGYVGGYLKGDEERCGAGRYLLVQEMKFPDCNSV